MISEAVLNDLKRIREHHQMLLDRNTKAVELWQKKKYRGEVFQVEKRIREYTKTRDLHKLAVKALDAVIC